VTIVGRRKREIEIEAERERFLDAANAAFACLRDDPERWREEIRERSLWEGTLADDLSSDG
jgi:hypothetical protein